MLRRLASRSPHTVSRSPRYHEWTAATVFHALVRPALFGDARSPDVASGPAPCRGDDVFCHLSRGAASSFAFDACGTDPTSPACGAPVVADGWLLGEDVVGKAGWVSCNSNSEISFRMTCAAGDLVLGYLESYDARMGVVNVTATSLRTQRTVHRNIDSKKTAERSIFALSAIPGLSAGPVTVSIRVMQRRHIPVGRSTCASFLSKSAKNGLCCFRDKFKLLSLACT